MVCLTVCTFLSASPLLAGRPGLEITWVKPNVLANFANCGPLSEKSISGIPKLANWASKALMTVLDFVSSNWSVVVHRCSSLRSEGSVHRGDQIGLCPPCEMESLVFRESVQMA